MNQATITKLRNALAQIAAEWIEEPPSAGLVAEHPLPFSSMTESDWLDAVRLWRGHAAELLATVPARPCPACGASRSRWLFESYDLHPYHECEDCGCWFVPKEVDSAMFDRLFTRSPEAAALARRMMSARDADAGREADMARVGGYLDDLLPMLTAPPGRPIAYLDTGCGVGHSLRAGIARGLQVQGVEVDRTAIALARADGLPVAALGEPIPPGPYQLLSFWETLEHIADPLPALNDFVPLLADDGLVAITVPNLNALATRVLRESCAWIHGGYNTPGHLNMFHAPALERLLGRAGLTILDADGQFSGDPVELFAALSGATRGAFDNLDASLPLGTLPLRVSSLLKDVWPGAALVERLALASPILYVVACRRGQEGRFAAAMAERRRRRGQEVASLAGALLSDETDYREMSARLQRDIDRRDELHWTTVAAMQHEINRRDDLLDAAKARFNRTVESRVLAGVQLTGRLVRRLAGKP